MKRSHKTFLVALLAFIGLVILLSYANASNRSDAVRSVFRINGTCSAVAVDYGTANIQLLTAKHCIKKKWGFVNIEFRRKGLLMKIEHYVYDVRQLSHRNDLALLQIRDEKITLPTIAIASHLMLHEGDRVWAIGYPYGRVRTITEGVFNGYENTNDDGSEVLYRASAPATFGNSGGGLFQEDATGKLELIGITSRKYEDSEFMNLFVPIEAIRDFLRIDSDNVRIEIPPSPFGQ